MPHIHDAQFRDEANAALLRHHQHLTVHVVEIPLAHGCIRRVEVRRHAGLHPHIAVGAHRDQPIDEICVF
jgi:hypothetical protein